MSVVLGIIPGASSSAAPCVADDEIAARAFALLERARLGIKLCVVRDLAGGRLTLTLQSLTISSLFRFAMNR